jgi:phosphohistidine phosphatase
MNTIYLVQHGIACTSDIDDKRPLTEEGREKVKSMAQYLKDHHIYVHKIIHSGKLRAQQTADIFQQALNVNLITQGQGMNPNDDTFDFIKKFNQDVTMYVGHLPQLSHVVSALITGQINSPVINFKNASVASLQVDKDRASLNWFITPDLS